MSSPDGPDAPLRILLVDDDAEIRLAFRAALTRRGHSVVTAATASEARELAATSHVDVGIIDLMLPDGDGFALCAEIGRRWGFPTVMLTARDEDAAVVSGLASGADDYVVKPVAPAVLEARLRAVLRRGLRVTEPDRLSLGDLVIDQSAMRVYVAGSDLDLSATEFRLLSTLVSERGHALSRGQLIDAVWADSLPSTARVVDTTIQRVRAKLAAAGVTSPVLETLRGIGYLVR